MDKHRGRMQLLNSLTCAVQRLHINIRVQVYFLVSKSNGDILLVWGMRNRYCNFKTVLYLKYLSSDLGLCNSWKHWRETVISMERSVLSEQSHEWLLSVFRLLCMSFKHILSPFPRHLTKQTQTSAYEERNLFLWLFLTIFCILFVFKIPNILLREFLPNSCAWMSS